MIGQYQGGGVPTREGHPTTAAAVNSVSPMSVVENSVDRVASLVNSVECKVMQLKDRLKPITNPLSPPMQPPENKPAMAPSEVPLCIDLDAQASKLEKIIAELNDLERRLGV